MLSWSWAYLQLIVSVPWADRKPTFSWSWAYLELIVSVTWANRNLCWADRELLWMDDALKSYDYFKDVTSPYVYRLARSQHYKIYWSYDHCKITELNEHIGTYKNDSQVLDIQISSSSVTWKHLLTLQWVWAISSMRVWSYEMVNLTLLQGIIIDCIQPDA